MSASRPFRRNVLREAGAAILFFGALAQQPALHQAGQAAQAELANRGYRVPSGDEPLRVFPALTDGEFSGRHAGGWRPGSIYLRSNPLGGLDAGVYLRHEMMHEASHRSCAGRLPLWAEEAAAMSFSGELAPRDLTGEPSEQELENLRAAIRRGGDLGDAERELLGRLLIREGWPEQACAVSPQLADLLGAPFDAAGSSAFLLMNLSSGRILEASGDQQTRYPPGSLLKIPYAAALRQADAVALGAELTASNTDKLLLRRTQLDGERLRLLLSPLKTQAIALTDPAASQEKNPLRGYLGERGADGAFPIESTLSELALALRAALLSHPDYFSGLSLNGISPDSTLFSQPAPDRNLLRQIRASAKTGTVSDPRGNPLVGHLLVVWPVEHPAYLALFRQRGIPGAAVLQRAAPLLNQWRQARPARYANVKVRLLTLTPRASWEAQEDCPALSNGNTRVSLCGQFRIVSTAKGSRSERWVSGILKETTASGAVILETDSETYADAVLDAEAQELKGAARAAMRAVVVWNAGHGAHRHGDTASLCDTTHCMVFLGNRLPAKTGRLGDPTDPRLLEKLDRIAAAAKLDWLPFANGGGERWQRRLDAGELAGKLGETELLEIRRERRKDGSLFIHLFYNDSEEVLGCEMFRNTFKLPSCPDTIEHPALENAWRVSGVGQGHGQGMSILRAKALAEAGADAEDILRDAFEINREQ